MLSHGGEFSLAGCFIADPVTDLNGAYQVIEAYLTESSLV